MCLYFALCAVPSALAAPDVVEIPQRKPTIPSKKSPPAPPPPDVWSQAEIDQAHKLCIERLANVKIGYVLLEPIKKGVCGTPAPLKVTSFGSGKYKVQIVPAAILNCKIAKTFADWFRTKVQPAARMHLKAGISSIRNVASYACRHRYGNPKKRMSEHAFANALDIAAFQTSSGEIITLLNDWGLTRREIADREKTERDRMARERAEKLHAEMLQKKAAEAAPPEKKAGKSDKETAKDTSKGPLKPAAPDKEPEPRLLKNAQAWAARIDLDVRTPEEIRQEKDPKRLFLRSIYHSACSLFGTVLSPEANRAHRDHFHLDLAPRKRRAYCE